MQVGRNGKTMEAGLRDVFPAADWAVLLSRTQVEHEEGRYRF